MINSSSPSVGIDPSSIRPKVVYLSSAGLLEPLGQSQVLSYLRGLSKDFEIIVFSREKTYQFDSKDLVADLYFECAKFGIDWRPKIFRNRPRLIAPFIETFSLVFEVVRLVKRERVAFVHARSYFPAAVAWIVWRLTGTQFLFDMRGLWPEERITAGSMKRGSLVHRVVTAMESACLRDAAAIVSLTHAAATYLQERHNEEIGSKPLVIIPTCADLDRFSPSSTSARARSIHGCIGTITSGWFRIDWLAAWFAAVAADDSEALFEIVTRDDPARVRAAVDPKGCIGERLAVFARRPAEMPETVRAHKTSAMFYAGGEISEIGRSPTRMAEVLGSGIPVIANGGIGDVEKILREHRVGVIVSDSGDDAMVAALKELQELQRDPELASRCRTAAAEIFSLDRGTQIYRDLYRVIVEFGVAKSL